MEMSDPKVNEKFGTNSSESRFRLSKSSDFRLRFNGVSNNSATAKH